MPLPEDAWSIAYLRDGQKGAAEALFAAAVALGWITRTTSGLVVNAQGRYSDPLLGALHGMMRPGPATCMAVRACALEAAQQHQPSLEALLAQTGLARSGLVSFIAAGSLLTAGLFVELIAFLRLVLARAKARSSRADRYLRWLDGATTSLRIDVVGGRRSTAEDVATVAAISGLAAVAARTDARGLLAVALRHRIGLELDGGRLLRLL